MKDQRASRRRAALYARVSTDEQAAGTSLTGQIERCRQAAQDHGWNVVAEFIDEGISGALSSRPALDQVVRLVEDGEIDIVIATKLDRVARSLRHLLELLDVLERCAVTLVALDDPLDPSTASGRAMVHLRGVFAELERQLIRERTTEGLRLRAEAGGWTGGPPPFGYRLVPAASKRGSFLGIDDEEAAVVRLLYKMLVEDTMTTTEAAIELRRLGAKPRKSQEWNRWNVRRMITESRGWSGQWPYRRAGRQGRDEADEIIVTCPAILTPAEHERLLAVAASTTMQPTKWRSYLLRRRLYSPHGVRMQGVPGQTGARWYRCPHAAAPSQRPSTVERCECRRVHAATVEEAVWEEILELLGHPNALQALAAEHEELRAEHAHVERDRLAALDARIVGLEEEIAEEYAALRDEGFDAGAARAAIRKRNDRLISVRRERDHLLRLRGKNLAAAGLAERLRSLAGQARDALIDADDPLRRKIIDLLDLRVQVTGWEPCKTCPGTGMLHPPRPSGHPRGRSAGVICPDCLRTKHIPVLRISGHVPELLLVALAEKQQVTELTADQADAALAFEVDIYVA